MVWSWSTIVSVVVRACSIADTRSGSMSAMRCQGLGGELQGLPRGGKVLVDVGDDAVGALEELP